MSLPGSLQNGAIRVTEFQYSRVTGHPMHALSCMHDSYTGWGGGKGGVVAPSLCLYFIWSPPPIEMAARTEKCIWDTVMLGDSSAGPLETCLHS